MQHDPVQNWETKWNISNFSVIQNSGGNIASLKFWNFRSDGVRRGIGKPWESKGRESSSWIGRESLSSSEFRNFLASFFICSNFLTPFPCPQYFSKRFWENNLLVERFSSQCHHFKKKKWQNYKIIFIFILTVYGFYYY